MHSLIAKLDLASYNFPICNIGSAVNEPAYQSENPPGNRFRPTRAATASLTPILKPHHDPFTRVRTAQTSNNSSPSLRKRQIKSQMNQRGHPSPAANNLVKPLDFAQILTNRNNSIIQSKASQRTTFNLLNGENALNRNPSDAKVISMNDQTKFRKSGTLAKPVDREKFDKKYVHFKRTQHRTYLRHIGRFNSLAEITNRADSIIQPAAEEFQKHQEEVDKALSQVYVNTRQKAAFLEKQTNQMVRLRRKILDGEVVDLQKYYPGMKVNDDEKNQVVAGNNFWLPVAGAQSLPATLDSERQPHSPLASNRLKEPEQQQQHYVKVTRGPKLKPYKIERMKNSPYLRSKRTSSNGYEGIHQSNSALFVSNSRQSIHQDSPNTQAKQGIEINQFKSKECLQSLEGSMIMMKQAGEYNLSRNKGPNDNQSRMSDPKIFSTDFHLKFHETEESERSSLVMLSKQKPVPSNYSNVNFPKDRVNPKENAFGRIDKLFKDKRDKGGRKSTDPGIAAWDHSPIIVSKR